MNNIQRTNTNSTNNSKNKSMEVIGDALLNMVITLELSERFPWASSGELTCRRAHLVSRDTCAHVAHRLGLGGSTKAMIGTIFTDSGKSHEVVHAWIVRHWSSHLRQCVEETAEVDAKTRLQECTQRAGLGLPTYVVETTDDGRSTGHGMSVSVSVSVASHKCTGEGTTKKLAEKEAATKMVRVLKEARYAMMSTARRVRGGGIVFPGTPALVAASASDLKHMCRWHAFHTSSQFIRRSASPTSQILSS
jgi:ribonuclease-3